MVHTHFPLVGAGVSVLALLVSVLSFPPVHSAAGAQELLAKSWANVTSAPRHAHPAYLGRSTHPAVRSTHSG